MPYVSKKQQGYFHAHEDEIGSATVKEFDQATKGKYGSLPDRVGKKGAGPVSGGYHPAAGSGHAAAFAPAAAKAGHATARAAAHPMASAQSMVGKVMAKQMATRNATILANMTAPKKMAGY